MRLYLGGQMLCFCMSSLPVHDCLECSAWSKRHELCMTSLSPAALELVWRSCTTRPVSHAWECVLWLTMPNPAEMCRWQFHNFQVSKGLCAVGHLSLVVKALNVVWPGGCRCLLERPRFDFLWGDGPAIISWRTRVKKEVLKRGLYKGRYQAF